ncbi:TAP-like protein-domain-containing protein [Aspergillus avenaceus]|uniref:TAP-like protein-domain-containing protein n=1 Tax=Aspergillus avenaceus TaxID=36643 RepID=A0A5N6TV87_ASPAV|nr:TAP-like protein-domain-containing protein [Aspergillus avenaceus]
MHWKRAILLFTFFGVCASQASAEKVAWGPCDLKDQPPLPVECGSLAVPLDYSDPGSDKLDLQLLKVPALRTPKKGSILFNFGGPGVGVRDVLAERGELLHGLTGGYYDLIGEDPRGTVDTLTASCFKNATDRAAAMTAAGLSVIATPEDAMALGRQWAGAGLLADSCFASEYMKENGTLISTAYAARDLMQVVDAVEEDGLLRYWGFSYGTVLGATVAAMFPDRVDKLILDAVMNPHEYYNDYDKQVWADADKVFSSVMDQCIKTPERCVLARKNTTAADLEKATYTLLDNLKREPISAQGVIVDHSLVKSFIRACLYRPEYYPNLAVGLDALFSGNATGFLANLAQQGGGEEAAGGVADEAVYAIPCSEKRTGKEALSDVVPDLGQLAQESKLIGDVGSSVALVCTRWQIEAKERYEGTFDVKTRNPVLVIGNTYDSATPLVSAKNISASFEGSVVLEHGGWGHGTLAHGSACTSRVVRDYWMNGTLPQPGSVCEPDYPPFNQGSLQQVLENIGFIGKD